MSEPRHTPGPWHFAGAGILMNDTGAEIALSNVFDDDPDGRLIAAAPDLLDAARCAFENLDAALHGRRPPPHNDLKLAGALRAAIAKAEGR